MWPFAVAQPLVDRDEGHFGSKRPRPGCGGVCDRLHQQHWSDLHDQFFAWGELAVARSGQLDARGGLFRPDPWHVRVLWRGYVAYTIDFEV